MNSDKFFTVLPA